MRTEPNPNHPGTSQINENAEPAFASPSVDERVVTPQDGDYQQIGMMDDDHSGGQLPLVPSSEKSLPTLFRDRKLPNDTLMTETPPPTPADQIPDDLIPIKEAARLMNRDVHVVAEGGTGVLDATVAVGE
jgi:hypothetical protein